MLKLHRNRLHSSKTKFRESSSEKRNFKYRFLTFITNLYEEKSNESVKFKHSIFVGNSNIHLSKYVRRIQKYGDLSEDHLIHVCILLNRLKKIIHINVFSIHRILLTLCLLVTKQTDIFYSNEVWAIIGGVSLRDINRFELFCVLQLDLFVTRDQYINMKSLLQSITLK